MVSVVVFFVLSFSPRGVLDEILNLIESVSEAFPSYSFMHQFSFIMLKFSETKRNHENHETGTL